ncbi:sugar transferase [Lutibacter holmesii]|uniref:Sugar transferase n=1 Tax=Lutibacter holmesii TaxID=1137985 RepID=A0ABW3WRF0_9FLAO
MIKRVFDLFFGICLVLLLSWLFLLVLLFAIFDTQTSGVFIQKRIGQFGIPFSIYKFRTIHPKTKAISRGGRLLRKLKLDELPQLLNVINGSMSVVGPRPDIEGYYDQLKGNQSTLLKLKPGLTCEATIKYRDEETLLKQQEFPLRYNDEVIFPDKVQMNLAYYKQQSFLGDLKIIWKTITCLF